MNVSLLIMFFSVFSATCGTATCQCQPIWDSRSGGIPGVNGEACAVTVWDPDGVGPLRAGIVVGGQFSFAGERAVDNLAFYDPSTDQWSLLGSIANSRITALATMVNGDLLAGGYFLDAGGNLVDGIARWNGSNWTFLSSGALNSAADAICVLSNGDLIVAGDFDEAGGQPVDHVARWDGTAWHSLGSGVQGSCRALTALANGEFVVGGSFWLPGAAIPDNVARWDGTNWLPMGSGLAGQVESLVTLPNGSVVAGGSIAWAGGAAAPGVAQWDGLGWSAMGSGLQGSIQSVTALPNGDVVATGHINSVDNIARFDGTSWNPLGSGLDNVGYAVASMPNGDLIATGLYGTAGGVTVRNVARWDGNSWSPLGEGTNGVVTAATSYGAGYVVAGRFTKVDNVSANHIAAWDGTSWSALGAGFDTSPSSLVTLSNGNLVVGGVSAVAGTPTSIAQWNGSAWSPFASVPAGEVVSVLAIAANGDLIVAGSFRSVEGVPANNIARFDGNNWMPLGIGLDGWAAKMVALPNGDIVVSGAFTTAGGLAAEHVARWDGSNWWPMAKGLNRHADALLALANGDVVAAGGIYAVGSVNVRGVVRWNGTTWVNVGGGLANAGGIPYGSLWGLVELPNGDMLVSGRFDHVGGLAVAGTARWDGSNWSAVPSINHVAGSYLLKLASDEILAYGWPMVFGGRVSYTARMTSTCPAQSTVVGMGCTGIGGANRLVAVTRPWIGSILRTMAAGASSNALALNITGWQAAALPLASVLPQAVVGCPLLVATDQLDLYVPNQGIVNTATTLPNSAALGGMSMYQQVVLFELDSSNNIVAVTSTNALKLVVGVL